MQVHEEAERKGEDGDAVLVFEGSPAEIDGLIADLTKEIGNFDVSIPSGSIATLTVNPTTGNFSSFDAWFERASRARWNEATAAIRGHLIAQFAEAVRSWSKSEGNETTHYWCVPKELIDPGELETARTVTEKQVIEPTLQELANTRGDAQDKRLAVAKYRGALEEALYRLRAMAHTAASRDPALASSIRETIELLQQLFLTERSNWEDWVRWRNKQRETYGVALLALEIIGRTLSKRLARHLEQVGRLHDEFLQRSEAEYGQRLSVMRQQQERMYRVWQLLLRRIDHALYGGTEKGGAKGENWALEALLKECELPEHQVTDAITIIAGDESMHAPVLDVAVQNALEPWPGVLAKLRSTDEWLQALTSAGDDEKKKGLQRQVNAFERALRQAMGQDSKNGWVALQTAYLSEVIAYRQRLSAIMDRLLTKTRQSNEQVTMALRQKLDGRLERANLDRSEQLRARETRRTRIDSRLTELATSHFELQRLADEWRQRLDTMVRDLISLLERAETVRCLKTLFLNRENRSGDGRR